MSFLIAPFKRFPYAIAFTAIATALLPFIDIRSVCDDSAGAFTCISTNLFLCAHYTAIMLIVSYHLANEEAQPPAEATPWYILSKPHRVIILLGLLHVILFGGAVLSNTATTEYAVLGGMAIFICVAPYVCREASREQIKSFIIRLTLYQFPLGIVVMVVLFSSMTGDISEIVSSNNEAIDSQPVDESEIMSLYEKKMTQWLLESAWLLPLYSHVSLMLIPQNKTHVFTPGKILRLLTYIVFLPLASLAIVAFPMLALQEPSMLLQAAPSSLALLIYVYLFFKEPDGKKAKIIQKALFICLLIPLLAFGIYALTYGVVTAENTLAHQDTYLTLFWAAFTGYIVLFKPQWPALRLSLYAHAAVMYISALWIII